VGRVALGGIALLGRLRAPPSPQGWSPARPVKADGGVVLVAHKAKLFSLPGTTSADLSSNANWQFPPKDKNGYPVSEQQRQILSGAVDQLGSIDEATKARLQKLVSELTVAGPSKDALKNELKASAAPDDQKNKLSNAIDAVVKVENDALKGLQAFYGDIGLSTDNKTAFLTSFRGMVFALDVSNGHTRWIRDAGDNIVGGIAVDGDTLYFGTKGDRVYAVDAKNGERIWQFNTSGEVWATPALDGDRLYVTSLDGSLYALDKSGNQQWVFRGAGSGIAAHPVVSGDSVYVGSFDNKLYSVKKSDGTLNWSLEADNWFWATRGRERRRLRCEPRWEGVRCRCGNGRAPMGPPVRHRCAGAVRTGALGRRADRGGAQRTGIQARSVERPGGRRQPGDGRHQDPCGPDDRRRQHGVRRTDERDAVRARCQRAARRGLRAAATVKGTGAYIWTGSATSSTCSSSSL
jgi:outer membrane protein assembly factor BamB